VFHRAIDVVKQRMAAYSGNKFTLMLRALLFEKIQTLSMSSVQKKSTGDLMGRINNDVAAVQTFITGHLPTYFSQLFSFILALVLLLWLNPLMCLFVFIPLPMTVYIISKFWGTVRKRNIHAWMVTNRTNRHLQDILNGIRVVKSYGREEYEIERFEQFTERQAAQDESNAKLFDTVVPLLGFAVRFGSYLILFYGNYMVFKGGMEIGDLHQFNSYANIIYGPLMYITFIPRNISNFLTSLGKVLEILEEEPEVADISMPIDIRVEGDISFKKRPDEKSIAEWIRSTDSSLQAGDVVKGAKFFATKPGLMKLYDAWGEDNLRVQPTTPEETCFSVTLQIETNEKELINFALMHAPQIELIAPQDLRDLIRARAAAIQSKYLSSEEDKQGERYNSVLRGDGILYASDRATRKRLEEKGKTHCVKHLAIDVAVRDLSVLFNDYPNVRTIRFLNQDKIDLSDISIFKALEELSLSVDVAKKVTPRIINITQLANCPLLRRLDLSGATFNETDFKKVCPTWKKLDKLEIVGCEFQNLDFLKGLPHLRFLYIGGKHLQNIDGLKDGKWLRHVVIDKHLYERFGASIKQGAYNKTISYKTPRGAIHALWRKKDLDPNANHKLNR